MFSHYIGVIESRRVARLLEDLPDDYTRTFERILDEIREAAAPKLKRQADDKLHEIRNRTDLLEGVHEIIEYAKRINTRTERVMCPHCQKVVLIGNRRDGSLFIRNSENG